MDLIKKDDFPLEAKRPVLELNESLTDLKECLDRFNRNYANIKSGTTSPLLKAKLELTNAYAINSLFWIYLTTKGVNPHDHPIKQEIIRLKTYAQRVQQIEDKQKALKVDTNAAKRFIRSALWEPNSDSNSNTNDNKRRLLSNSNNESKDSIDLLPNLNQTDSKNGKKFKK